MRFIKNLNDILKHPSTTLIVGDTGEGKTVAAASALDWFHGKGVYCYFLDKQKGYPDWVHNVKEPEMKEPNSVLVIDDAHNRFYAAQEQDRDELMSIDLINRARRHGGKRSVIYTTQQSTVLSRRLIGMTTFMVFKKSSPMMVEFERPEFQKLFLEANEALKDQPIEVGYVVSSDYRGLIKIDLPEWWTQEVSEGEEHFYARPSEKHEGIASYLIEGIKGIGAAFG